MPPKFHTEWHYITQMVHAGERLTQPPGHPTSTPLYGATTYYHDTLADFNAALGGVGYAYGRNGNPTNVALEVASCAAESALGVLTTASGMAAIYGALLAANMTLQQPTRCVLAPRDMYGATTVLLRDFFAPYGIEIVTCVMTDLDAVATALVTHRPGIIYAEQLSNPTFRVIDIEAIAELAHAHGAKLVVDNTIATPVLQRPLLLGADFVAHSATKYFSGHGDATGGIIAVREQASLNALRHINATLGMVLGPYEALHILRGMKTMPLRVQRQCQNSLALAQWLAAHPAIAKVIYPGLASHPDHALATRTLPAYGAMLSFELAHPHALEAFVDTLELVLMASTLGDIYSMISIPALASHRGLSPQERQERGISDGLIRMSVGIEEYADIRADLDRALNATLA